MSQVRLASRLAASAAHLRFPPKDALYVPRDAPAPPFSPEAWALVHPPPPSALAAFAHRLGIPDSPAVLHACTHPSFLALFRQLRPGDALPATNAQLAALGNALMGLFASEHLHAAYPHLPTRVLKAAVTARVGPLSCANVAQEIGAAPLVRWHRTVRIPPFFFASPLLTLPRSRPRPPVPPCFTQMLSPPSPARSQPSSTRSAPFPPPASLSTPTSCPAKSTFAG